MTQTSPKPADQTNTNIHKPKSPTNSYVDGHTSLSLEKLIPDTKTLKPKPKLSSVPVWQGLRQWWDNLNFRSKLAILLVGSAALPVIGVTQGIVAVTKERLSLNFKQSLQKEEHLFIEDYVLWNVSEGEIEADTIAKFVQSIKIDLSNPSQVANQRDLLQTFINQFKVLEDSGSVEKNIRIITDAQGRTVAQNIQTLAEDSFNYPPDKVEMNPRYRPVSLPLGIYLGDIPIVKDALRTEKTLSGIELFKGEVLQRLGQEKQADIGLRTQPTQGLTESEQPFPQRTYDIDGGRAGLVGIAVHPIKIGNKLVGTVIVGSLMNRSSVLVDSVKVRENVPFSTVFAQDWRVSTNVPYSDRQTRDIGTRAPRKVAQTVLNQGQEFIGPTKIGGVDYLAVYQPLYDHQKQLNPTGASPVGMVFVGRPRAESESLLAKQEVIGFSIGGSMLLLAGLVALPIASSFSRPLRRLAGFAQQVGAGEQRVRLETTERQDEIGVLSQELNKMATSIEINLEARRQEAERAQLFADIAARARESQDLELVFNKAVEKAREMLNADRVVVYRFNADWSGYIKAESVVSGWPQALADKIDDACIREELIEAYRKGRVVATNNVFETDYSPDHIKLLERLQIKASLVTPIVQNDQLFGLLIAHQCDRPHIWQQSEVNFLTQLAVQLGLILDRVTFLEQQTTAKEQLQKRALELVMEVEPISSGNLTVQAQVTEDAIGTVADSYNATIGSLRQIVTQVQSAAKQVATTTSSSEVSVLELSAEALRQAQEITVALDRIEEMSDSIRAVAANAQQAEAAVQQATQTVEAGDAAMNRTVDGIMAIRETVAETSKKVKRLGESSQKISKVVNLIGTFADKTNLLALNAAIEAANAGEQGRGFAVVADQVRALARQSAQATAEIESLVKDIQTETNAVVAAMEAGTEQVVAGTKLVDETRQSLNQITTVSAQIGALVDAIASAAAAQSQVSESVTETMSDMAAIAQHTSNEATVVSASFKELQAVAQQLQASVGQFKVS